jgi:hypothetical protein
VEKPFAAPEVAERLLQEVVKKEDNECNGDCLEDAV